LLGRHAGHVTGYRWSSRQWRRERQPAGGGRNENRNNHSNDHRRAGHDGHLRARRRHRAQSADQEGRGAAPPCDIAFGGGIQSDYNFRGVSQSDRGPGVWAYVEPRCKVHPNIELYTGLWGWSTKLPTTPSGEFDVYGGVRVTVGPLLFDFGAMYYWYPREVQQFTNFPVGNVVTPTPVPGFAALTLADTDFWEIYGKMTWTVNDWLALSPYVYYADNFLNSGAKATYAGGIVKVTIPSAMMPTDWGAYISAEAAHYWLGTVTAFGAPFFDLPDYTYWNAGVGFTYKIFTVDFRYHDTDLSTAQCFTLTGDPRGVTSGTGTSRWCGEAFIAKLSFDMTLNNNIK
jgi:hypothetical protein